MPLTTLALDLEGTLISNAVSQLPRPGLHDFAAFCLSRFTVYIFTAVREPRARDILERLAAEGDIPQPFATLPYVPWHGEHKDLRFLQALDASLDISDARLVDDLEAYIHPDQRHLWIPIPGWHAPYPGADRALPDLQRQLLRSAGGDTTIQKNIE